MSKNASSAQKGEYFSKATAIWDGIKEPSTIHLNALLRVCSATPEEGGWDYAVQLLEQSIEAFKNPKEQDDVAIPAPDTKTFTIMMRFAA